MGIASSPRPFLHSALPLGTHKLNIFLRHCMKHMTQPNIHLQSYTRTSTTDSPNTAVTLIEQSHAI